MIQLVIPHKEEGTQRISIQLVEEDGKVRSFSIKSESKQFDRQVVDLVEDSPAKGNKTVGASSSHLLSSKRMSNISLL